MRILLLLLFFTAAVDFAMRATETARTSETRSDAARLFNGKNLAGWSTYLEGRARNHDPAKVFQVHDGVVLIHKAAVAFAKMPFGYIATEHAFAYSHSRLESAWC